ncbi:MAG: glutamate mutase L [Candidatus Promineifilaceae bacterium]
MTLNLENTTIQRENGRSQTQENYAYLVADCGRTTTTVTLFDVVEGRYRFVARGQALTTADPPWFDLMRGVQQAISQISEATGRLLLNDQGILMRPTRNDGSGVDYFGAVISAAEPLEALIVGLLDEVSVASARHALETIYAREVDHFSLADKRNQQNQIDAILKLKPDIVLIAGGTDGSTDQRLMDFIETIAMGISMMDVNRRPVVVYAGNSRLRAKAKEALSDVTSFHVADNVRPSLEEEQIGSVLGLVGEMYEARKIGTVSGIDEIMGWSTFPVMPTAHAFAGILEYFATLYKGRVMGLDIGSDSVTFVTTAPDELHLSVRSDLGMGRPIEQILAKVEPAAILEWVLSDVTPNTLRDFIFNKALKPYTVPITDAELHLEQAIARQMIRLAVDDAMRSWGWPGHMPEMNLLILRGGVITNIPRSGQAILMVLDAIQPTGLFPVVIDRYSLLPAMGLLAAQNPRLVVQVLNGGVLEDLGWVIAPNGRAQAGDTILNVRIESESLGSIQIEVAFGTLEVLPLAPGQKAVLTLEPQRRFDVGAGPGRSRKVTVYGGTVGLIIDARGRPIKLPKDDAERQAQIRQWLWDLGG